MYLNNKYGCCVVAALCHGRGVTSANSGLTEAIFSDDDITKMYEEMSGGTFNPADPNSDQGCDEQTALGVAETTGYTDGVKEAGHMSIDATNWTEVCLALYLFEVLISGQGLPAPWIAPFPSPGAIWDVAGPSVPTNGHAVVYVGYNADKTLDTGTWGMRIKETAAALAMYASPANGGELYVVLNPDLVDRASQKAPNGIDWSCLVADLTVIQSAAATVPASVPSVPPITPSAPPSIPPSVPPQASS